MHAHCKSTKFNPYFGWFMLLIIMSTKVDCTRPYHLEFAQIIFNSSSLWIHTGREYNSIKNEACDAKSLYM